MRKGQSDVLSCRDFERAWNDRLDARLGASEALDGHAATCLTCRAVDARYRALVQAIGMPAPTVSPSSGFADRVLAAAAAERNTRPAVLRFAPGLAAAAAVVAAVALGWNPLPGRARPPVAATVRAIDANDLSDALADAGSATWELAREASAPAARVGRQVLGSAALPRAPAALSMRVGVGPAAEVWQRVEDRVNAGARPLGGTARHAFGFLIGAAPEDDHDRPASSPAARPAEGA